MMRGMRRPAAAASALLVTLAAASAAVGRPAGAGRRRPAQGGPRALRRRGVLLTPDVGDVGYIDFDHKRRAIAAGVESARAALPRIRAALAAWHPHARRAGASP